VVSYAGESPLARKNKHKYLCIQSEFMSLAHCRDRGEQCPWRAFAWK